MRNVFDTNIWLGAWDENYARNVFPDVWGKLSAAVRNGLIVSPPAVNDEVLYPDDLREWISEHREWLESPMIETPNFPQAVADEVGDLRNKYPKLAGVRKDADYQVVAWGKILNIPVVTGESRGVKASKQPKEANTKKIPAACRKENVKLKLFITFMQEQGWRFIADKDAGNPVVKSHGPLFDDGK